MSEVVDLSVVDGIATLTICREEALNALNREVLRGLEGHIAEIEKNKEVRGLIVTGAGEKAFVAGADIGDLKAIESSRHGRDLVRSGQGLLNRLEALKIPVLAAVNGFALGGGLELALACHFRYAVKSAQLGLPEVKLGVIPGYGGTQRLLRAVGRGRATEMIVTGGFVSAEDAEKYGLVNGVFEDKAAMLKAAMKTLKTAASRGPIAVSAALEAIHRGSSLSLADGLALEADLFAMLCSTRDMREGLAAFLEKRQADFQGS